MNSSDEGAVDRISALPESLILHILSFLKTKDSVRTSLLSKHWADLWTNVPCLEFIERDAVAVGTLIDKVLRHWRATKILKFKIDLSRLVDDATHYLDFLLRFATEKKVESLAIYLPFDGRHPGLNPPGYEPPECLYSCSSITKLSLVGFSLGVGGNVKVQWYNLKSLYLKGLSLSEDVINQVVSSAPRLEHLDLRLYYSGENLNIRSSSLKTLMVDKYNLYTTVYTNLTIWAPKLQVLRLGGNAYSECSLMDVSSVTQACLYFHEMWDAVELRHTLMRILPKIQHVESLTLSPCSLKMLGVMLKGKYSFSPFSNVKKLEFYGGPIKPTEIDVDLAELLPKVETLKIVWRLDKWYPLFLANLLENNVVVDEAIKEHELFWMQLKRVEFTWYSYEESSTIFLLIDFLLKHAVREIVIQKGGSADVAAETQFRIMYSRKIFPTKDISITFFDSEIIIKRIK